MKFIFLIICGETLHDSLYNKGYTKCGSGQPFFFFLLSISSLIDAAFS